jgi:hypothetical protein
MNKKYTQKALDNYRKILVAELKRELNKKGSRLESSIVGRKIAKKDGFNIKMNSYGVNVNDGRSAGKFPNIDNIKSWIERNNIRPKNIYSSKPPSLKQLAFLIGRSIASKGIKPHRFIDEVIEKFEPRMTMDIVDAYTRDLSEELDKNIPNASSKN